MKKLLEVENLSIRLARQKQHLVRNTSFTLYEGTALAIIGESGSGKTLTCKAIMQLLNKKLFEIAGSIRYRSTELMTMDDKKIRSLCGSKLSLIVQNPMAAFNQTVKIGDQIIETIRAHRAVSKKEAHAIGIAGLQKMNLPRCEQLMNSYPFMLSGGMLQRIVIALSLILEPALIIADEPTTALDVHNQKVVLDELANIKKRGISLLLVTHDFGVAARLADYVIVMKEGRIVEFGTIHEIYSSPKDPYTRELLEASILNERGSHVNCSQSLQIL